MGRGGRRSPRATYDLIHGGMLLLLPGCFSVERRGRSEVDSARRERGLGPRLLRSWGGRGGLEQGDVRTRKNARQCTLGKRWFSFCHGVTRAAPPRLAPAVQRARYAFRSIADELQRARARDGLASSARCSSTSSAQWARWRRRRGGIEWRARRAGRARGKLATAPRLRL